MSSSARIVLRECEATAVEGPLARLQRHKPRKAFPEPSSTSWLRAASRQFLYKLSHSHRFSTSIPLNRLYNRAAHHYRIRKLTDFRKLLHIRNPKSHGDRQFGHAPQPPHQFLSVIGKSLPRPPFLLPSAIPHKQTLATPRQSASTAHLDSSAPPETPAPDHLKSFASIRQPLPPANP